MKQQTKDVYMTLFTGLGTFIGLILYFTSNFLFKKYQTFAALSIFGFAIIFRFIGYFLDKALEKKK